MRGRSNWLAARVAALRARRRAERGALPPPVARVLPAAPPRPEWWRALGLALLVGAALHGLWTGGTALADRLAPRPEDGFGFGEEPEIEEPAIPYTLERFRDDLWSVQRGLVPAFLAATVLGGAGLMLLLPRRRRRRDWPAGTEAWVGAGAWLAAVACPAAFAVATHQAASAWS